MLERGLGKFYVTQLYSSRIGKCSHMPTGNMEQLTKQSTSSLKMIEKAEAQ